MNTTNISQVDLLALHQERADVLGADYERRHSTKVRPRKIMHAWHTPQGGSIVLWRIGESAREMNNHSWGFCHYDEELNEIGSQDGHFYEEHCYQSLVRYLVEIALNK